MRDCLLVVALLLLAAGPAHAGQACTGDGASRRDITELIEPALTFPLGLATAPDGAIWAASTFADQLVRLELDSGRISVVQLPLRSHPVGLAVDDQGRVWFAGSGVGLVGRITPGVARAAEFPPPTLFFPGRSIPSPTGIALDKRSGQAWFTLGPGSLLGAVALAAEAVRKGTVVKEIVLGSEAARPESIAPDPRGGAWIAELAADALVHIEPNGSIRRMALPAGSHPRGLATAPDGGVWVALFGTHRLLRVDPWSLSIRDWPMPSGPRSNPYAVAVDADGGVWTSEFTANTITCFDPIRERFISWDVPTRRAGVRALTVDRTGRIWFVGSYSGRLGVVGPR